MTRDRFKAVADNPAVTVGAVLLAAAGFAGSFAHTITLARHHGQGGWIAWTIAGSVDLLALIAGLELRLRLLRGEPTWWPKIVVTFTVVVMLGTNLATAGHLNALGQRVTDNLTFGDYWFAMWPAVALTMAAGLLETRPGKRHATGHKRGTGTAPASGTGTKKQQVKTGATGTGTPPPKLAETTETLLPVASGWSPMVAPEGARKATKGQGEHWIRGQLERGVDLTWQQVAQTTGAPERTAKRWLANVRNAA